MAIGSGNIGMGIIFTLTDKVSAGAKRISNRINSMKNTVKSSADSITGSFDRVSGAFMSTATTTAALIAPFAIAVKKSAEFEAQMSDVGAKSNSTRIQLKALSEQALQLSSAQGTAQFTAKQVGEGMSFLAMAGFNTEQIMASVKDVMMLASAGNLSLAESADIASNVMSGFNLKATDMARITDVLAFAATKSNQSVHQLGEGMKFLAPTAAALGISLEESTATMMMLANAGLQGSLGTRALGTSLASRLTKPTKAAAIAMKELGLQAFDTQGDFVGMINLVRQMEQSTANLTQKQRQAAIATIFGGESIQELNVLMTQQVEVMENGTKKILQGADALEHFTKANQNASGTAKRIAKQQLDNLKGDITVMLSSIDTTLIKIGASLTPVLRPLVQAASAVVAGISAFIDTPVGRFLTQMTAGVAALTAGIVLLNFSVNIVGKSFIGMARAAITAMIPLAPLLITVGAIVGTVVFLTKSVSAFNDVMDGTTKPAKGMLGTMQKIGGVLSGVIQIFKTWNGETFTMSKQMADNLKKMGVFEFFQDLGSWITRTIEFTKGFGKGFMDSIRPIGSVFKKTFKAVLKAVGSVMKAFGATDASIKDITESGVSWGKLFGKTINFVLTPIKMAAQGIIAIADAISWLSDNWNGMTTSFSNGWGEVKKGFAEVGNTFSRAFSLVGKKIGEFIDYVFSLPSKMVEAGKKMGQSLVNGISSSLAMLEQALAEQIVSIFGTEIGSKINAGFGIASDESGGSLSMASSGAVESTMNAREIFRTNTIERTNTVNERFGIGSITLNVDGDELARKQFELDEFNESLN